MLVGEYLDMWLDTYVTPFRAPSTAEGYRRAIDALPLQLLRTDLRYLNGLQIQSAINRKAALHPRAAQLIYAMLSVAMARAVRLRMIDANPMDGVDKPKHKAKRTDILTPEQLGQYLAAAAGDEHYPLLLIMATCGLRRGEALGLTWAAIDGDLLHIRQQRMKVQGMGLQVRPLKSEASRRTIPLPPLVLDQLQGWKHRTLGGWIVDSTPDRLYHAHLAILRAAQLPHVTLHALRHSMAAAMAADGTPIKILQGILGHSHYQLTADLYADHIRPEAYRADLRRHTETVFGSISYQGARITSAMRL